MDQQRVYLYGLRVSINLPLTPLAACAPADGDIDTEIVLGHLPADLIKLMQKRSQIYHCQRDPLNSLSWRLLIRTFGDGKYFHFQYDTGVQFICNQSGSRIWGTWIPPMGPEDAALYLLGPILGFVLRLRGITCLHSSCILIDETACAFIGPSGAGKSTLATAFALSGFPVISDDILALDHASKTPHVFSAYPRLKLWPDTVDHFSECIARWQTLTPNWEKCYIDPSNSPMTFRSGAFALKTILMISRNNDNDRKILWQRSSRALLLLLANSYRTDLAKGLMRKTELSCLTHIANSVPVGQLYLPDGFNQISQIKDLIQTSIRNPCYV